MDDNVTKEQSAMIDFMMVDVRFVVSDAVNQMNWFRQCGGVPGNWRETSKNYQAKYGDSGDGWEAIMKADMDALTNAMNKFADLNNVMKFPTGFVKEAFGFNGNG